MMKGHVYILKNDTAPNVVKVGRAVDVERRLRQHNAQSATVGRWTVHWSIDVPDVEKAETMALRSLSRWKVSGRREQFQISPGEAVKQVAVALAEWSDWGRQEKERQERAAEAARAEQEAKERARQEKEKRLEEARERNRLRVAYLEQ